MIVIPMAGLSRRFREAGFALPKYMLDLHGRSLFARTVSSFERYFVSEPFLFIAREEADTLSFIQREVHALGIVQYEIVVLDRPTRGQAETVYLGIEKASIPPEQRLTIFNIDTIRPDFRYPTCSWMSTADGYLEVMVADDPGYSYVRPDPAGDQKVIETAEKRVISNLASTGLYYFRRTADFMSAFAAEAATPSAPELYVAPLYNHVISRGGNVRYVEVPERDVLFSGTPTQYADLQRRNLF